jgi:hypothetical protein
MKHDELKKYNHKQLLEMDKHKWIESEKAGKNLGDVAYLDWIKKHSKKYREEYEQLQSQRKK